MIINLDTSCGMVLSTKNYHKFLQRLAVIQEVIKQQGHSDLPRHQKRKALNIREHGSRFSNPINLEIYGTSKCPSKNEIIAKQSFKVCPAYYVIEYDSYRIPAILLQVRCKCLSCHGPHHGPKHKCSPMFKFVNAYRVVDKTHTGIYIYDTVREPVSYACQCKEDSFGIRRTYIPP